MGRFTDWTELVGQNINRWNVIALAEKDKRGRARFLCRCECGTERIVSGHNLKRNKSKSCGCYEKELRESRVGPASANWKGGKHYHPGGYVIVTNQDYPGRKRNSRAFEHRVVMTRHLGRPLHKGESVHHKNGVRDDNRIENLELWTKCQPTGKRVQDLVKWAKELLSTYEPEALNDSLNYRR